jgi:Dyp-type peroxidase family
VTDLADVQGLVFSGYKAQPLARYFFLRFGSGDAHGFLGEILNRVSSAAPDERDEPRRLNVALSVSGLRALGLDESAVSTFPRELQQGMAHPERSLALGDLGPDAPEHWQLGRPDVGGLDAVVFAYASTEDELDEESELLESALERHRVLAEAEDAYLPADGREHFGFADARTNPRFSRFSLKPDENPWDPRVPLGELLLGHRNARGVRAAGPSARAKRSTRELALPIEGGRRVDLGKNGSYLVLRKLEQDVPGFFRFVREHGDGAYPGDPDPARHLAAAMVGRWPNGASLVLSPEGEPPAANVSNRFGYREHDELGRRCPFGAHARRANPRDQLGDDPRESLLRMRSHRLVRRGRLYGPRYDESAPSDESRGLFFMALCASLSRQFEFVQESLLENDQAPGVHRERDPLVGRGDLGATSEGDQRRRAEPFTIPAVPYARSVPIQRFVRVRGGAYLFLPSLRALAYLAEP